MYYFFDVSKQILSQTGIVPEIGIGDSYCSISVECQERGHGILVSYKAYSIVNR